MENDEKKKITNITCLLAGQSFPESLCDHAYKRQQQQKKKKLKHDMLSRRAELAERLWGLVQEVLRHLHTTGPDAAVVAHAVHSMALYNDFFVATVASDHSLKRWLEQFAVASQIGVHEMYNARLALAWSALLMYLPRDALPEQC
eukprot:Tamp_31419.p1 GENE.Tamp_31419~~Tamp_31419.p1  ORF type:complete len:145 (+),score=26.72 Tamp_31419:230-664(+)